MRWIVGVALLLVSLAGSATTATVDYTDLWWNPDESGWGMQLVQQDNVIVATLFLYDPSGAPTWALANLTLASGGPVSSGDIFSGDLYVTNGPYYGAVPFDPTTVLARKAGTMTFSTQGGGNQIVYSIDGIQVTKNVVRQLFRYEHISGRYVLSATLRADLCSNPANSGTVSGEMMLNIVQSETGASGSFTFPNGSSCTLSNSGYSQEGRFGTLFGNFSCTSGEAGFIDFTDISSRVGAISGRIVGNSTGTFGCIYNGRFGGVDPSVGFSLAQ